MTTAGTMETTQYLTFNLDTETFAIDISQVREVLDFTSITRIPRTPEFMHGVINLRGRVVPVVDLRLKFGMPRTRMTVNTCIIIVEVAIDDQPTVLGALADSVQEVIDLEQDSIEPRPSIGTLANTGFIKGMGKQENRFVIILDIEKVFSSSEISVLRANETTA